MADLDPVVAASLRGQTQAAIVQMSGKDTTMTTGDVSYDPKPLWSCTACETKILSAENAATLDEVITKHIEWHAGEVLLPLLGELIGYVETVIEAMGTEASDEEAVFLSNQLLEKLWAINSKLPTR